VKYVNSDSEIHLKAYKVNHCAEIKKFFHALPIFLQNPRHFFTEKIVLVPVRSTSLFLLLLLVSLSPVVAQEPPGTGIAHFGLVQLGAGVRIEVTLAAGFTCNGIQLLRSPDSLNFETIGLIGGVCGSTTEEVSYDLFDPQPLDGRTHYYSLLLGGRIPSEVLAIRLIDFQKIGFLMWPNPARDQIWLRWENEAEHPHELRLLSSQGQLLQEKKLQLNQAQMPLHGLPAGLYHLQLRNQTTGTSRWQTLVIQ